MAEPTDYADLEKRLVRASEDIAFDNIDGTKRLFALAASTISTLIREREWRLMEAAPRDGTAILIWQPDKAYMDSLGYDDHRYAIGYWRTDQDPARDKWMWGNRNSAEVTPLFWMPLPRPPVISSDRAQEDK